MIASRFNFRVYVKKYNKIYRVCELHTDNKGLAVQICDNDNTVVFDKDKKINPTLFYENEIELMQSTGMIDNNIKEIFENDFLKVGDKIYIVHNYQSEFLFESKNEPSKNILQFKCYYNNCLSGYSINAEVIGNKFQNPELLEEFIRK